MHWFNVVYVRIAGLNLTPCPYRHSVFLDDVFSLGKTSIVYVEISPFYLVISFVVHEKMPLTRGLMRGMATLPKVIK